MSQAAETRTQEEADQPTATQSETDPAPAPDDETQGQPQQTETIAMEPAAATLEDTHDSDHWRIISSAVFLAVGVAVLLREPSLLLAAVVGVGMLAYRRVSQTGTPSLAVQRRIETVQPDPEEPVRIETTVRNVGEQTLPDCRLVDRLPAELSVVDGSPRVATMLRPGETCTIRYTVEAERGAHTFDGLYAVTSDLAGKVEREYEFEAPDTITCTPRLKPIETMLLRSMTTPYAGRLSTDEPGEGLEFHATREYQPGDALRRVDWNQYASTGELATLQFRTERAASVVVIADVRPSSYVRAAEDDPHAAGRCVDAASRLFVTLLDNDHRAGIATFGPDYWLAPDAGSEHRHRAMEAMASESALSPTKPDGTFPVRLRLRWLRRRLPENAQVILCSPLLDWSSETIVQVLESYGHEVTVVSPDPTGAGTTGEQVAQLERQSRISEIHQLGVPVVDWGIEESLDMALARTARGWSR